MAHAQGQKRNGKFALERFPCTYSLHAHVTLQQLCPKPQLPLQGCENLFLFFSLPKTKLVAKVTSRHLLSIGTQREQQVLAVLGTHGGMRDKSSEQMYSDVLKHRKGKIQ